MPRVKQQVMPNGRTMGWICTHSRIKVLSELLEVCQSFTKVNVSMLTVEQDAENGLSCTGIVDYLTATNYMLLARLTQEQHYTDY